MPYKKIHKDLRVAIGYILLAPELESKITSFDKLITPLTFLSGGTGGEDFLQTIDNSLFQNAFQDNDRDKVHITAYSDLMMGNNEYDEQEGEAHFLLVCNGEKADRGGRVYEVGRFTTDTAGESFTVEDAINNSDGNESPIRDSPGILTDFQFYQWLSLHVPSIVKDNLRNYLVKMTAERQKNAIKNAPKNEARDQMKQKKENKRESIANKRKQATQTPPHTPSTPTNDAPLGTPRSGSLIGRINNAITNTQSLKH